MRPLYFSNLFAANGNSANIDLRQVFSMSMITTSASSSTGTVKIQVSNDQINPTNWVDLPSGSITVTANSVQTTGKLDSCFAWGRIVLSGIAGGTSITATVHGLGA